MRRRAALVVSSLLTVLALAAGGWLLDPAGSRQPVEPAAAPRTVSGPALFEAVTLRMAEEQTATYTFSGSAGGGETRSGWGALRFLRGDRPARTFDADVRLRSNSTGLLRAVLLPDEVFLALPAAKGIPRSKPWLRVSDAPRTRLGRDLGPVAEQLRVAFDPGQSLGLLRAAERVEVVGPGTVEGVATTEHRALVRMSRAITVAEDPAVKAQYRAMLDAGVRTLRFQVWLDATGLPLRLSAEVPTTRAVFSVTGVYRRWGEPVRIAAPGAKKVFDSDRIKG